MRSGDKVSEDSYVVSVDTSGNYKSKVADENRLNHNNDHLGNEDQSPQKKIKTSHEESKTAGSEERDKFSVGTLECSSKLDTPKGSPQSSGSLSREVTSPSLNAPDTAVSSHLLSCDLYEDDGILSTIKKEELFL